jgi:peptidoglycan hydrolase-like protein with peptidoglycan-binding domain
VVSQGSTDTNAVRTVQGLLCARGHVVTVDGSFGPATFAALKAFQKAHGLSPDGVAGPASYPALMGVT